MLISLKKKLKKISLVILLKKMDTCKNGVKNLVKKSLKKKEKK
jgi:hypothetical protein